MGSSQLHPARRAHLDLVEVVKDVARVLGACQGVAGVVGVDVNNALLLLEPAELGA